MNMAELKLGPPKCADTHHARLRGNPAGVPRIERVGGIARRNYLLFPEPPCGNERGSREETQFRMHFDGQPGVADNPLCDDPRGE
jgi:hypothetical protein